jgi:molybdopterin synthase catalytic subunit/molybdopterin converting factor small subunit
MEVEVCFYGSLAHVAGGRIQTVWVEGSAPTVSDLREAIVGQMPDVERHLAHTAIGMGSELLSDDALLQPGAQISLLPPVSGGSSEGRRIQEEPLSLDDLIRETAGVDAGALVIFSGNVRAFDGGVDIAALDYDVHHEMAEMAIRKIEKEIVNREGVLACRIVHRVGLVEAGESSVYVVVRGRHRPEAFEAAHEGIERVKREVPIWKEDVHTDETRSSRPTDLGTPLR